MKLHVLSSQPGHFPIIPCQEGVPSILAGAEVESLQLLSELRRALSTRKDLTCKAGWT